jgi:hypothetical protein
VVGCASGFLCELPQPSHLFLCTVHMWPYQLLAFIIASRRRLPLLLDVALQVLPCLRACMCDYTTDNRGDVGSWVREAAMQALLQVSCVCVGGGVVRGDESVALNRYLAVSLGSGRS